MSTQVKPVLKQTISAELKTAAQRRPLVMAARELVKLKLASAAPAFGIIPQNYHAWCSGKDNALGETRQQSMMQMFGFNPNGQLIDSATHAWIVNGADGAVAAETMLTYERAMHGVVISPAYTQALNARHFIGAYVHWKATIGSIKDRERRLIMTAPSGSWIPEEFMAWAIRTFKSKAASASSVSMGEDLFVVPDTAKAIWRWHAKPRLTDGSRATLAAHVGLLPSDQDIVGPHPKSASESALAVLVDIVPRFEAITSKLAGDKRVGTRDMGLLRRAKEVIKSQVNVETPAA